MKPKLIRVYEHTSLKVGERGFRQEHFEALSKFNELHNYRFFKVGNQRIHFTEQVGVLQVGPITIEVLPKVDRNKTQNDELCQTVLLRMLQAAGYLPVNASMPSGLYLRHTNLLELYLRVFLDEMEALAHQGLVKRYRVEESNQKALKGGLQFSQHLSVNLIHKEHFYTRHQVYDQQHKLNLVLREALKLVPLVTRSAETASGAMRLLLLFPEEGNVQVSEQSFERLRYDRKTERYRKAVGLARLILLRLNPDVQSGNMQVIAFLFDMNLLFERYIASSLRRAARMYPRLEIQTQEKKLFWKTQSLQPDVILHYEGKTYIIDTKWKAIGSSKPDIADLRQIYAYNHFWKASSGTLLYPKLANEAESIGQYHLPNLHINGDGNRTHRCNILFANLTKDNSLNKTIGNEILSSVISSFNLS
jgi:5-methylcytosine-specific restriction enzyme subunit McrC